MKNKILILVIVLLLIVAGSIAYLFYFKNIKPVLSPVVNINPAIEYNNTEYGFSFALPDDWKGYSIIQNNWEGNPLNNSSSKEIGPKIIIRNPNWTSTLPYEDIPIMIFTLKQWNSYLAEDFSVGAAPIPAIELARNNAFVLALPARWNFDYSKGFEQADSIIKSNPIKVFNVNIVSYLKDGIQCYTYNHKATNTEPYNVNEFINMTIKDNVISGTKTGNQSGPDMTNGYFGTINGTWSENTIDVVYAYAVEGSKNKEKEIYKIREDQRGIEKLRYQLVEKNGILVPDTTKEFKTMLYARVDCNASN
ncbi:MAG: hypothetical protein NTU81_00440 [Candidatus Nomurabacteria bacterium]|nr:hypothetical protein [Candidatus Nomurabacteria bacterium]